MNQVFRIPTMFCAAIKGTFQAIYLQGENILQSDLNTQHLPAALSSLECLIVQDISLNEIAQYALVFLSGSSFLEKDGTFINAERRINSVRKVMMPVLDSLTGKSPKSCLMLQVTRCIINILRK